MDRHQYIYMCSDDEGQCVFPCSLRELKLTFKYNSNEILEEWPGNSHGPAYPMNRYQGTIVLDLSSDSPTKPLTTKELKELGVKIT